MLKIKNSDEFFFRMIENAADSHHTCAEIFLTEWSTHGKNRPTCQTLLNILDEIKFYKAADYLAENVLKSN